MGDAEEDRERMFDEECPGPSELDSALAHDKLADVAAQAPLILEASIPVANVIRTMQSERRACVLIARGGRLAGIFTERDVLMKIAANPIDLEHTAVEAFMTSDPYTLHADATVVFALNRMVLEGFRHIPIVDDSGHPIKVISMRNIIEYLGEIYGREMLTIPPEPTIGKNQTREGA
jgi:CBS domain-containing protein